MLRWGRKRFRSLNSFGGNIASVLMQRKSYDVAADIGVEGDLRFFDFQEILPLAFRENLNAGLVHCLNEQTIALARYSENEGRRGLVAADESVVNFRIDGYLCM